MDRAGVFQPRVVPYRDTQAHGLFATRSPCRPNPIGLSVVRVTFLLILGSSLVGGVLAVLLASIEVGWQ